MFRSWELGTTQRMKTRHAILLIACARLQPRPAVDEPVERPDEQTTAHPVAQGHRREVDPELIERNVHCRNTLAGLGRLPDAYRARVQFAKPIALPGRVGFAAARQDPGWAFAVVGKEGKPHLVGEIAEG